MSNENLKVAYQELCTSYRAIDDFRTKLLGLLPLATGAGIAALTEFFKSDLLKSGSLGNVSKVPEIGYVGLFGFVITLGLFSYEIYGIKKCHCLILAGKELEQGLEMVGQFRSRARDALGFINEPFAAAIIYPAVLASWIYVAGLFMWKVSACRIAIGTFVGFFVFAFAFGLLLGGGPQRTWQKTYLWLHRIFSPVANRQ